MSIPSAGGEVLVAIDVGTSGARASAFDLAGTPVAQVRRPYPTALPAEGWAEQDARRWQSASISSLTGLVRELGPRHPVAAIGITGQCPSVVPVDAAGTPLRPGIIYRDNRAVAEAEEICERIGAREVHALTGHVPAAFHVAAKMLWVRAHEPEVFAATRRFLQPSDCVVLALTGETATDWTMAAATALLDLRGRRWATALLAGLDLDPDLLPPLHPSWGVVGTLRPGLARRVGIGAGRAGREAAIPVVAGAGDSIACAVGAGVTEPGPVSEMAGSSTCLNSVVASPLTDLDVTHYPSAVDAHGYVTEVGINTTGEALDWVAQLFYSGPDRHPRPADYARMDRDAAAVPPGADGLLFAPVLGDGERDDPDLRGAVTGLSLRHDHRAWARAALEGVALGIRARLETLERASTPATELRISGGGAALDAWNQIKADVLGIPVVRVAGDATACGAALLAGIGTGIYRDAVEAIAAGYRPAARVEPRSRHREQYGEIYARYRSLLSSPVARMDRPRED